MTQFIIGQWIDCPVAFRRIFVILAMVISVIISFITLTQNSSSERAFDNPPTPPARSAGLPVIEQAALYELLSYVGAVQIEQQGAQKSVLLKSNISQWHGLLTELSFTAFTTARYKLTLTQDEITGDVILTSGHFSELLTTPWQVHSPGLAINQAESPNQPNPEITEQACQLMPDRQINLRALWPQRQFALITINDQPYRINTRQILENGWKLERIEATSATFSHAADKHACLHRIPLAVAI